MSRSSPAVKPIFVIAGLYDGLLGVAFLFAAPTIYERFDVTPPNHFGYIHFAALLLIVFALMFFAVAVNPKRNRNLIPYGVLLKVSYCLTVGWHWLDAGVPTMWKPFFVLDLAFIVIFIWAYRKIR